MAVSPQAVVAGIGVVAVALCVARAGRAWRRMQALADTPIARIRSAPQGYVELKGRAGLLPGEPILGPLSGLPCAWYRYRVEERRDGGGWRTVQHGMSDSLFLLRDDTGQCVVDPDGADVVKTRRDRWYEGAGGLRLYTPWGIGAHYRCTEQRILPGEEVHVLGFFRTVSGGGEVVDTRSEVARLLERWKQDPRRMALFDRNRDGRIDPAEWEAARQAAHRQVQREWLQRALEPDTHLLSNPDEPERPYLIAAVSERRLIGRYRRHALLYLLAALGLFTALVAAVPNL